MKLSILTTLIFVNFACFAGSFEHEALLTQLLAADPVGLSQLYVNMKKETESQIRDYIIANYKTELLGFMKPGLQSFIYATQKICKYLNFENKIVKIQFISNNLLMVMLEDPMRFEIWDISNELKKIKTINIQGDNCKSSNVSPDSKYAIVGHDKGQVSLFDLESGDKSQFDVNNKIEGEEPIQTPQKITAANISADNKFAIVGYDNGFSDKSFISIDLFNKSQKKLLDTGTEQPNAVKLSKSGKYALLSTASSLRLYDTTDGSSHTLITWPIIPSFAIFSPNEVYAYIVGGIGGYHKLDCFKIEKEISKPVFTLEFKDEICKVILDNSCRFAIVMTAAAFSIIDLDTGIRKVIKPYRYEMNVWPAINANSTQIAIVSGTKRSILLFDTSKWIVEDLSLMQLIMLLQITRATTIEDINTWRYNFHNVTWQIFGDDELIINFCRKRLLELHYNAPRVLETLVKEFMG